MKKLLILDCDWVLYNHRELDVNAMVYAFNIVCDELDAEEYKFTRIIHCTEDKPIKWFYNYIRYTSNKLSIDMDEFIEKMIDKIDYSRIERDSDWILDILDWLHSNYEICVCTNNHKKHLDRILEVKFNLTSDNFPYPCFDVTFSEIQWKYYPKQSPEFISKIESYFDIKPSDFVWIDDTPSVLEKATELWCNCILVDDENVLINILQSLSEYWKN